MAPHRSNTVQANAASDRDERRMREGRVKDEVLRMNTGSAQATYGSTKGARMVNLSWARCSPILKERRESEKILFYCIDHHPYRMYFRPKAEPTRRAPHHPLYPLPLQQLLHRLGRQRLRPCRPNRSTPAVVSMRSCMSSLKSRSRKKQNHPSRRRNCMPISRTFMTED